MEQTWDASRYAKSGAFVHQLAGGVVEWLAPVAGEAILDLGCGDGSLTERLAGLGAEVVGVDASPAMVRAAEARGLHVEEADATRMPFSDGSFDAVFSNAALHWIRNQDAMLGEVRRVLRRQGRFVAEMGGHGNIAAIRVAFASVLARYGCDGERCANYFPTTDEYAARLERQGFRVEQMALIPRPTLLPEGGMREWLKIFRRGVLDTLHESKRERVIEETVSLLEPVLRDTQGKWTADYVRLRFVARPGA